MRAILGKLSVLVLAAGLAGSAIVTGCSSNGDDKSPSAKGDQGSIGFQLDVGGGATINTMNVVVYGNTLGALGASTNITRSLDVGALSGNTTAFTLTLPAGANYQVKLSSPDNATCNGTGTFTVIAGQSNASTLSVTMSCTSTDTTGGETVNVTACTPPTINSVFVGPNAQAVGHKIQLIADVEGGSTIQWVQTPTTGGAGLFGSSTAATTDFTCQTAGSLTISLGLTKGGCSTTKTYAVSCIGSGGSGGAGGAPGAGAPGAGAPGAGAPAAGAPAGGTSGAPAGGAPAAGAPAAGAPAAGAPAAGAPAGGAPAGGAPGAGAPGAGAPGAGAPAGGAPAGGAPGASCPNPGIVNGVGPNQTCSTQFTIDECGTSCAQITKTSCLQCEVDDLNAGNACYDDGVTGDGSSLLNIASAMTFNGGSPTPAKVAAGQAYLECTRTTGCAKNGAVFSECYCGTSASCTTPGSANGPCKSQMEAALETTDPGTIGTHFIDAAFAGGVVNIRLSCDKSQCKTACLN